MDLQDQLKNLFPDHIPEKEVDNSVPNKKVGLQENPLICKYEKRKGKPITIIEGYEGSENELKNLAKILKKKFSVGGTVKNGGIIIQGDFRDQIMEHLITIGFMTKRVGG
ncbi:translation initiation factor [Eudoraea sp.]|uniref:translation initiation factor n=1 Tax=Eudoraea sp. TaxID=1979955 RepID=UPI003C774797